MKRKTLYNSLFLAAISALIIFGLVEAIRDQMAWSQFGRWCFLWIIVTGVWLTIQDWAKNTTEYKDPRS